MNHKKPYFRIEFYRKDRPETYFYIQPDRPFKQMVDIFKSLPGDELGQDGSLSIDEIFCSLNLCGGEDYNLAYYGFKDPDSCEIFEKHLGRDQFMQTISTLAGISIPALP